MKDFCSYAYRRNEIYLRLGPAAWSAFFQSETIKSEFPRRLATYLSSKVLRGIKRSSRVTKGMLSLQEGTSILTVMTPPRIRSPLQKGETRAESIKVLPAQPEEGGLTPWT